MSTVAHVVSVVSVGVAHVMSVMSVVVRVLCNFNVVSVVLIVL